MTSLLSILPKFPAGSNNNKSLELRGLSDIFAEHFAEVSSKDGDKPFYRQRMREESHFLNFATHQTESYNMRFDMRELLHALAKSKNTVPAPDETI